MIFRVSSLLIRILRDERFRKASPAEVRYYAATFAFLPLFIVGFVYFGHSLLHKASAGIIWLYAVASLLATILAIVVWIRFVPVKISVIASIIVWIWALWLAAHIDLAQL